MKELVEANTPRRTGSDRRVAWGPVNLDLSVSELSPRLRELRLEHGFLHGERHERCERFVDARWPVAGSHQSSIQLQPATFFAFNVDPARMRFAGPGPPRAR